MQIPDDLSNKQKEIVHSIFRFRFLNRIQIQTLLKHKVHHRVNEWLKDLSEKEYLGREYHQKLGENRNPAIYYLQKKGLQYLKANTQTKNTYFNKLINEEKISFITRNHSIQAADFYIELRKYCSLQNIRLEYFTKADLAYDLSKKFVTSDAYFIVQAAYYLKYYFVEIEMETETRATFRRKIDKYFYYYFSKTWKSPLYNHFPIVLIVCITHKRLGTMIEDIERELEKYNYPPIVFKLTIMENVTDGTINNQVWYIPAHKQKQHTMI